MVAMITDQRGHQARRQVTDCSMDYIALYKVDSASAHRLLITVASRTNPLAAREVGCASGVTRPFAHHSLVEPGLSQFRDGSLTWTCASQMQNVPSLNSPAQKPNRLKLAKRTPTPSHTKSQQPPSTQPLEAPKTRSENVYMCYVLCVLEELGPEKSDDAPRLAPSGEVYCLPVGRGETLEE